MSEVYVVNTLQSYYHGDEPSVVLKTEFFKDRKAAIKHMNDFIADVVEDNHNNLDNPRRDMATTAAFEAYCKDEGAALENDPLYCDAHECLTEKLVPFDVSDCIQFYLNKLNNVNGAKGEFMDETYTPSMAEPPPDLPDSDDSDSDKASVADDDVEEKRARSPKSSPNKRTKRTKRA